MQGALPLNPVTCLAPRSIYVVVPSGAAGLSLPQSHPSFRCPAANTAAAHTNPVRKQP